MDRTNSVVIYEMCGAMIRVFHDSNWENVEHIQWKRWIGLKSVHGEKCSGYKRRTWEVHILEGKPDCYLVKLCGGFEITALVHVLYRVQNCRRTFWFAPHLSEDLIAMIACLGSPVDRWAKVYLTIRLIWLLSVIHFRLVKVDLVTKFFEVYFWVGEQSLGRMRSRGSSRSLRFASVAAPIHKLQGTTCYNQLS